MSGYDALRAMRKGSDPDPDLEAWKNNIVTPDPYPAFEGQVQTNIDATVGDAGYDVKDENGVWRDDLPPFRLLRELREEGDADVYNDALERCSTYAYTPEEDPPERIGTPYPERETTQTHIDAHAAGGDNVWQRGQTARQQAAMARDAQQARDLARPYRMAPKVAYKQAQEEQNMEPTQKSAMPELPSISSMIKGKRENPRENLAEFQKGLPVQTELSRAAAAWNRGKGSEYTGLEFPKENQKSTDQQNPMTTDQRINTVWDGVTNATRHRGYDVSPASKKEGEEAKDSHDEDEDKDVKKSIANRATAEYLHEKYKPDPGYLSERRNEREGPHQPSVHSALNAIQSQANEQDRIDKERYNIAETGLQRGQADAAKLIEEMQAKGMSAEEIAEAMGNISNDAAPEDYRFTGDPNHDYSAWINGMGYAESLGEHRNDWIVGNDDNPREDPVVSAVRNNVRHQESLTNPAIQDERLGINRSQGMNRQTHEFVDASKESTKKSVQKYPNELPPISSMIKGKRENPRENLAQFKKRDTRIDQNRMRVANHNFEDDVEMRRNISHDLHRNDGDRTGVIYDRDRDMYPGSHVGRTPFLGDIPERRDRYIDDMDTRQDALWSMSYDLVDENDDITNYAKQHGLDPYDLRSFMRTLVDHYRDNRLSAKQTKDNLSSVVGDETQDEES